MPAAARSQALGNAGTVEGVAADPSGAAIQKAEIRIHDPITGYSQSSISGNDASFQLVNIPPNQYHLEIRAPGFAVYSQDVTIRNSLPLQVRATPAVAGSNTTVNVEAAAEALEIDPSAHVDAHRGQLAKIPALDPGAGLSQAIVYSTGGVAADGNGFFHPLGDHVQVGFVIDGQPISDQQSKVFSTQLPVSAVQSMDLTTGSPNAEFGDKTSLVAQVTTRSGLGVGRWFGNVDASYGSFGTAGGSVALGYGTSKVGNLLALDGVRSGRVLDTPEFTAFHDIGTNQTIFDRFDFQPIGRDALHLNLFAARNWIQIPDDYDQLSPVQDQRQRVLTWNIAPGYQHTFSANALLTINSYVRKDQFNYYPSRDVFADLPATQGQQRQFLNWVVRADISTLFRNHNLKYGIDLKQTRLLENFQFGVTDPAFNSPCVDSGGNPIPDTSLTNPARCAAAGFEPNTADSPDVSAVPFSPGLLPFDLTRGGNPLFYHSTANINQFAGYFQDAITAGPFLSNVGFRLERYNGLVSKTGPQPTVLRVAYARALNVNLLLSSSTGLGGLAQNVFGSVGVPISPGNRNQFNAGLRQAIGRFLLIDADYFWKYTHNAYDFNVLLNTTITFPIAWHNSKLDGITGRVSTTNIRRFQAYWTFGHTWARYFPPENGGLIFRGALPAGGVFRMDHDQVFQSTMIFRYQRQHSGEWVALICQYDNGLIVSGIPDAGSALTILTPNQQVSVGVARNGVFATVANPLSPSNGPKGPVTSKLITLPQGGFNGIPSQDHNPDRVTPRHILNPDIGTGNLWHSEDSHPFVASVQIDNLTNQVALNNFLSTFSGTHFLLQRTVVARFGFVL
jgi:hypothetical protein